MTIKSLLQQFSGQTDIVGRMLAGYGELEFDLCQCVGDALGDLDTAVRTLFRMRGEDSRLRVADALLRPYYEKNGLGATYGEALGAFRCCKSIRNQYAHCHWYEKDGHLLFYDLDKSAQTAVGQVMVNFFHSDAALLEQQEAYFDYADRLLMYLHEESRKRAGLIASHDRSIPAVLPQPPLSSSPPQPTAPSK